MIMRWISDVPSKIVKIFGYVTAHPPLIVALSGGIASGRQRSGRHALAADGLEHRLPAGVILADFHPKFLG